MGKNGEENISGCDVRDARECVTPETPPEYNSRGDYRRCEGLFSAREVETVGECKSRPHRFVVPTFERNRRFLRATRGTPDAAASLTRNNAVRSRDYERTRPGVTTAESEAVPEQRVSRRARITVGFGTLVGGCVCRVIGLWDDFRSTVSIWTDRAANRIRPPDTLSR